MILLPKIKPKAIIFDWDNTLVDTWNLLYLAINDMRQAMDLDVWDLTTVKANIHHSARNILPQIFGDKWQYAAEVYQNSYLKHRESNLKLLPNVIQVLDLITENNIPIIVISNKRGKSLREEAHLLKLEHYFTHVIGAEDLQEDKPSAIPVEYVLNQLKLPATNDIWFIGDSIIDMECAHNSKCQGIYFGEFNDFLLNFSLNFNKEFYMVNHLVFYQALRDIY